MNKFSHRTRSYRPAGRFSLLSGGFKPPHPSNNSLRQPPGFLRTRLSEYRVRLKAAGQVGRALAECLTLPELYENISESVFKLFPQSNLLFVFRTDEDSQGIQFIHAVQNGKLPGELGPLIVPPPSPAGPQGEVVYNRRALIINDLTHFLGKARLISERAVFPAVQSVLLAPMVAQQRVMGVLELLSAVQKRYDSLDAELLSLVGNTAAMAIQNQYLRDELTIVSRGLSESTKDAIEGYRRALELRDRVTEGHSIRVAELTVQLALSLGVNQREMAPLRFGAMLHDIGKIGVPDRVLLKPGPLDEDDKLVMNKHPQYALEMLGPIPNISPVLEIPYYHHEKWDGTGYPTGLEGEAIPLPARIFAVIDVYDALRSDRPYRSAWKEEDAVSYIRLQSGRHFDPRVVEAFMGLVITGLRANAFENAPRSEGAF